MRPLWMIVLAAMVVPAPVVRGQQLPLRSSLMFRGTFVTSSRVFDNPDAPVAADRDHYNFVDNLLGGGFEYRLSFPTQDLFLTLNVEYVTRITSSNQSILVGNAVREFPIELGVRFIPVELGVNTSVPIVDQTFSLVMGAGFGAYYADRVFGIGGVRMKSTKFPLAYGIHIESGLEYRIFRTLSVCLEMRFRDPEVTNESAFDSHVITIDNIQVPVDNTPPKTRVNVHGVSFTIGLMLDLGS